jgi:iron complex transport system substrate-binding protein
LCGDAYLLALAPDQISALSWQSRSPLSTAPETLQTLPQAWDDPEKLIGLNPTHIVFGPGEGQSAKLFLAASGITPIYLDWGEDLETVKTNMSKVTDALNLNSGFTIRGTDMNTRKDRPQILYLSRSGASAGPGTYVDAIITQAGGDNIIETPGWITPDPEYLITLTPDLIITSFFTDGYESVQAKGVRHKVLSEFIAKHPQVEVPGALWPCAGPGLFEAAKIVSQKLDTLP